MILSLLLGLHYQYRALRIRRNLGPAVHFSRNAHSYAPSFPWLGWNPVRGAGSFHDCAGSSFRYPASIDGNLQNSLVLPMSPNTCHPCVQSMQVLLGVVSEPLTAVFQARLRFFVGLAVRLFNVARFIASRLTPSRSPFSVSRYIGS